MARCAAIRREQIPELARTAHWAVRLVRTALAKLPRSERGVIGTIVDRLSHFLILAEAWNIRVGHAWSNFSARAESHLMWLSCESGLVAEGIPNA